jgi:Fe-S-cluster-containing dehydrogenase component
MRKERPGNGHDQSRRDFCRTILLGTLSLVVPGSVIGATGTKGLSDWYGTKYKPKEHLYAMGIKVDRCIGCGRCVDACKRENNVPDYPFYTRTWIERYITTEEGQTIVDSPNGGKDGFKAQVSDKKLLKTYFVPKICNQCHKPPCVQVCPVGATYKTDDGVILVDPEYCIGCRYCIQACPYGMRYFHPKTRVVDKCTFCYHRIVKGLLPACVEVCPTQARVFGDLKSKASPVIQFVRFNKIFVLKPDLNTEPKVYYADLDMEVR